MLGLSSRSPHARSLLDTAAELAAKLEVAWFVVHVRQPMALHYGREATEYPIPEADLAYAKRLGATAVIERGEPVDALIRFARTMKIAYFITGRSQRSRFRLTFQLPMTEQIQRRVPNVILLIV